MQPSFADILNQLLVQLLTPILGVIGVLLRVIGVLGAGVVAGKVLRQGVDFKLQSRFFVPLVFLGIALLFAVAGSGTWSSSGTLGALGIGLYIGYQFMRSAPQAEAEQSDDD